MATDIDGNLKLVITSRVSGTTAYWDWQVWSQSYGYSDSQAFDYSDAVSGSVEYFASSSTSQTKILKSGTVTKSGGTPGATYTLDGSVSGAFDGSAPSLSNVAATLPVASPAAPSAPAATRVSDTSQSLAWSRNATSSAPYSSQSVLRRRNGGAWATIVTGLSGSATSYTDTTTAADGKYEYRIKAINATGSATSSASSAIYTTPAAPTGAAAVKDASGDIVVTWANACTYGEYETEVWESQDGGAYALLATVGAGVATYSHVSPLTSVTHRYQVRAKTSTGTALYSTYSTTGTVTLTAPPNAPTGLGPSTTADATEDRTLVWTHNPTDSSPQSKFQLRHRASGGAWTTVSTVTSATSSWLLAGGTYANGATVEWEVRTWGESTTGGSDGTGASVYSATASFVTSARPTATISAPADAVTLTDSIIAIAWTYYQAASSVQAQWRVTLISGGVTLEVKSGSGTTAETTMATPGADATTYTVEVEVLSSAGLWSSVDSATFDVDYLPPSEVEAALVWDRDSGVVQLTLTKVSWDGTTTIEPVAATVDRSTDAGDTWTRIATALTLGDTTALVDTTVPTHADVLYRITAISALPSTFVGTPAEITINETERAYLGYGASFATILVFYGNLTLSSSAGRAESLEQFSGRVGADNRPAGVIISGEARMRDVSVAARFINSDAFARRDDFEAAALAGGLMCYRDPSPRAMFGKFSGLSTSESVSIFGDVSFLLSEATNA